MGSIVNSVASADRATHLLQDLAPELALRWIARATSAKRSGPLSPALFRGLISVLLRSSSHSDAESVLDLLDSTSQTPNGPLLTRLGFSAKTPIAELHNIIEDLVKAAIFRMPLSPSGPALAFYCTAGVGSSDDAEYEGAKDGHSDPHLRFSIRPPNLADIREKNVILAVGYFSSVFYAISRDVEPRELAALTSTMSERGRDRIWKITLRALSQNIQTMSPASVEAIQALFGSLVNCESSENQEHVANELVTVFNSLAMRKGCGTLGLFVRSMPPSNVVVTACRLCLVKVFKASDASLSSKDDRLTIARFVNDYVQTLFSAELDALASNAVPALITALGEAWLALGEDRDFAVRKNQVSSVVGALQEAMDVLDRHSSACIPRDLLSTKMMLFALCDRVAMASNSQSNPTF